MIEHAGLIAVIIAVLALMGLIYIALFMRSGEDTPPHNKQRDTARKAHNQRWEDRL